MSNVLPMQSQKLTKKANNSIKKKINMAGKQILKSNEILSRVEINVGNNCLFTLKDHKDNFANNPQVRLINPAKNENYKMQNYTGKDQFGNKGTF